MEANQMMGIDVSVASVEKMAVKPSDLVSLDEVRVEFGDNLVIWLKWDQLEELNQHIVDALNAKADGRKSGEQVQHGLGVWR